MSKERARTMNVILAIVDSLRWDYFLSAGITEVLKPAETFLCKSAFPATSIAVPILLTGSENPQRRSFKITTKDGERATTTQILEPTIIDDFEAGIYINIDEDDSVLEGCQYSFFPGLPNERCLREFLEAVDTASWCAVIHLWDVHYPYGLDIKGKAAIKEWYKQNGELELRKVYTRAVARLRDNRIPELMKLATENNALLVFTSDHGELLGEDNRLFHGSPMVPELEEVPLIFWPTKKHEMATHPVEQSSIRQMILDYVKEISE